MILYHGTSTKFMHDILENGIKCRRKRESLWPEHPSCRDRVYLTNAYAVHFAANACLTVGGDPMIVEVDVSGQINNLVPDEDVMAQVSWGDMPELKDMNLKERTVYWAKRTHDLPHFATFSLEKLGTVAHMGDIPSWCLNTHLILPKGHDALLGHDPTISLMNYKLLGKGYAKALTKLVQTKGEEGCHPSYDELW